MMKRASNANKTLHKTLIAATIALTTIICTPVISHAEEVNATADYQDVDGIIDGFFDTVPDGLDSLEDADDVSELLGVKRILTEIFGALKDSKNELGALLLALIGIALLSALAALPSGELSSVTAHAVSGVSAALLFERLAFLLSSTRSALGQLNGFFASVIPVTLAVNSLGASPTAATTQAMGMGLTLSAYSFVCERLLGGVVGAIFITSALSGFDGATSRLAKSVKGIFLSLMGALTVLIGATFSLQSAIATGADSVAIRSARYAVSGTIPIVGNAVSGALGLVAGGVSYARSIVGAGAVAVVLTLVLSPIVTLLAYRFCLRLGMGFCSHCSSDALFGVLGSFCSALDTLIAVYALTSVVYITELVAFLKGGVGLA